MSGASCPLCGWFEAGSEKRICRSCGATTNPESRLQARSHRLSLVRISVCYRKTPRIPKGKCFCTECGGYVFECDHKR